MKKIAVTILFFLFLNTAHAAEIAIVDVEQIIENSIVLKNVKKQLEKKKTQLQKEIEKKEAELNTKRQNIINQSSVISQEAMEKKMEIFQKEVFNFQQYMKSTEENMKKSHQDAIMEINDEIKHIVKKMRNKEGYKFDIAISSSALIYSKENLDISAEVLRTLNKNLRNIKINL